MTKKNILVTGALGYLGSNLVTKLHKEWEKDKESFHIIAMDVREPDSPLEGITYLQEDIRSDKLEKIFKENKIDTVVHLAAIVTPGKKSNRELEYSVDVLGTQKILEACIATKVKRILVTSSGAAYGYYADNPDWLQEEDPIRGNYEFAYSYHKRLVEEMLAEYREKHPELEQTIFRVCTILGDNVNNQITNLFSKKRIITLSGSGSPFVFIWDQDIVGCLYQGIFSEKTGIFNAAGDGALTLPEIAQIMNKPCIKLPPILVKIALTILKPLGISRYGPEQVRFLQYRPVLLNKKLKEDFGYIPQKTSREVFDYFLEKREQA